MSDDCFYRILGFTKRELFSVERTKAFYKYLQLQLHPDKLDDGTLVKRAAEVCKLINKAKNVLLEPRTKGNYDWSRIADFNGTIMHHDCGEFRDANNWLLKHLKGKKTPDGMRHAKVNMNGYETDDSDDSLNFRWDQGQGSRRRHATPPFYDSSSDEDYMPNWNDSDHREDPRPSTRSSTRNQAPSGEPDPDVIIIDESDTEQADQGDPQGAAADNANVHEEATCDSEGDVNVADNDDTHQHAEPDPQAHQQQPPTGQTSDEHFEQPQPSTSARESAPNEEARYVPDDPDDPDDLASNSSSNTSRTQSRRRDRQRHSSCGAERYSFKKSLVRIDDHRVFKLADGSSC